MFLLLVGLALSVVADQDICAWQQPRAGVVRDALYIEGGIPWTTKWQDNQWLNPPNGSYGRYGTLYRLNFSKSFDSAKDNLLQLLEYVPESLDATAQTYVDGGMFADNDEWYTYGGFASDLSNTSRRTGVARAGLYQPNEMATAAPTGTIKLDYQPLDNISTYVTWGSGVSVPSESLGFYFSGFTSANNTPFDLFTLDVNKSVSQMLKVSTANYGQARWTELPLGNNVAPRGGASTVWLPVGSQGALVVIGGAVAPAFTAGVMTTEMRTRNNQQNPSFVSNVSVYDISNDRWYTQETTGPGPTAFTQACAVVATAKDKSSHSIYVYGGWDGTTDNAASDEVWILSVPAFRWIRASSGTDAHGRYSHVCAKPYENQMITVGGVSQYWGCLKDHAVIDVFNLNTLTWTGKYDPTVYDTYKVPSIVSSLIGGGESGGANTFAQGMDSQLRSLLKTAYGGQIRTWGPYTPAMSVTRKSSHPSWMVPVIATIVSIVGITLVAAVAWFCVCSPSARRKRTTRSQPEVSETPSQGFMSSWLRQNANNTYPPLPPKSIVSEDVTEIGTEPTSPRYEVPGFTFYKPKAQMRDPDGAVEADSEPVTGHTRLYSETTSAPGSAPGSPYSSDISTPPLFDHTRSDYPLREHHMYPHAFDEVSTLPSVSSPNDGGRYANARPPQSNNYNPMFPHELGTSQSTTNLGQILQLPIEPQRKHKHAESVTESTISQPTDTESQSHVAVEQQRAISTPPLPPSSERLAPLPKQGPPSSLATRHFHQRNTSSQASIPFTLSPTTPDQSTNLLSVSPGEERRRSEHINSLPDRSLPQRDIAALAESKHFEIIAPTHTSTKSQSPSQKHIENLAKQQYQPQQLSQQDNTLVQREVRRIESREDQLQSQSQSLINAQSEKSPGV